MDDEYILDDCAGDDGESAEAVRFDLVGICLESDGGLETTIFAVGATRRSSGLIESMAEILKAEQN